MVASDPLARLFDALGDGTRRQVLVQLARGEDATATQLSDAFPVTRQAVAKHLQVLMDAGLVRSERRGRETVFSFLPDRLGDVRTWLADLQGVQGDQGWESQADDLRRHLEERRERRGLPSPGGPLRAAAWRQQP